MSHYGISTHIQRTEVHAENFSAYVEMMKSPLATEMYEGGKEWEGELLCLDAGRGRGFDEARHFVDCILAGQDSWSTLDEAVHTMRLSHAIREGCRGSLDIG